MIYLTPNISKNVNITVGDLAQTITATYSASNSPDVIIDLIHFMAYGEVGSIHMFNTSQAYIEDNGGQINQSSVATITQQGNANKWLLECIGEGDCFIYYRGFNNSLWELHLIVSGYTPPTIVTYVPTASYVWTIQDQDTFLTYTFSNNDISDNNYYYNSFSFSVITGATYGLTAGIIPAPSGNYIYNIYQTAYDGSLTPINYKSLEVGLLIINGTYSNPNISVIGDDDTIKVDKNID